MLIVNCIEESRGWSPIQHMVMLAAELFEADVLTLDDRQPSRSQKALSFLQGKSRRHSSEPCLVVCAGPSDLPKILKVHEWRKRCGPLGAWVIDSFWTEHIPKSVSLAKIFDGLFVTSREDVQTWERVSGVPTTWLPWGTDALRLGSWTSQRRWDISRVGRQPPDWEEDQDASDAAARLGIKYRPRPASNGLNTLQNQRLMMEVYADTKYVLAFSNIVNPEPYTHKTRQYVTGRWVDGLAGGAVLAGVPPKGEGVQPLLWDGATLDFGTILLEAGLEFLAKSLRQWTPQVAVHNHLMALRNLDWRWRFKVVADSFRVMPTSLGNELALLQERISRMEAASLNVSNPM